MEPCLLLSKIVGGLYIMFYFTGGDKGLVDLFIHFCGFNSRPKVVRF